MVVGFVKHTLGHLPMYISNEMAERVHEYEYLGTIIDDTINFGSNVNAIYKKTKRRLYFVRQLRIHKVNRRIIDCFYPFDEQSV